MEAVLSARPREGVGSGGVGIELFRYLAENMSCKVSYLFGFFVNGQKCIRIKEMKNDGKENNP